VPIHPLSSIIMDLFDNLSDIDEDAELDSELHDLFLVLNDESDSDSSENEPFSVSELSEAEASASGAIPPSESGTNSTATSGSGGHYHSIGAQILSLTRKRDGVPIPHITQELGMFKSVIYRL
jgi:hypothetical protein